MAPACAQISVRGCRAIRARPQPLVRRAPAVAQSGAQLPCSPGTPPALGSTSPGPRAYSARDSVLPGHFPSPWFSEPWRTHLLPASPSLQLPPLAACHRHVSAAAAASARCLCAATSPPLQLPQFAACAPFSAICALRAVCFCAALCVAISLRCVRSPKFALFALCSVACAIPSGSCQPGCALLLSYGSFASAAQRSHCMFRQWDLMDS